jgi:hypothetical protein
MKNTYVIRHTDYVLCCYSGQDKKNGDTMIAKVSPDRTKWVCFPSLQLAKDAAWKIRSLRTSAMLDKLPEKGYNGSKWVVVEVVNNDLLETC